MWSRDPSDVLRTSAAEAEVIELSAATADHLCLARTGANPARPHMVFFDATDTRAVLSFVASGHVAVSNLVDRVIDGQVAVREEADPHGLAVRRTSWRGVPRDGGGWSHSPAPDTVTTPNARTVARWTRA